MNIRFELKNADSLKFVDEADLMRALQKACALVERSAKENAPKGTGELRRSITSEVKRENGELVGVVFTPLEYAPYVEFGTGLFAENGNGRKDVPWHYQDDEGNWHTTSGQHPHPFMRPAYNQNREEIMRIIKEAI
jgi:HK97 gp10 family phage protein